MSDTPTHLLGKQVIVTLQDSPKVIARGRLLRFGDDGEFVLQDDEGFVHYAWPMLNIEEFE